jgi:hypothetical protein
VVTHSEGRKNYNHPAVGRLVGEHISLSVTDNPELKVVIITPTAEADSVAKFRAIVELLRPSAGSGAPASSRPARRS